MLAISIRTPRPSLNFDAEKIQFREFYDANQPRLDDAKNSFVTLINALTSHVGTMSISKIEGRVKDKEECIKKFNLKYRTSLEINSEPYAIRDHITDLVGLRVVGCRGRLALLLYSLTISNETVNPINKGNQVSVLAK